MSKEYSVIDYEDYQQWAESIHKITGEVLEDMWEEQQDDSQ